MTRVRIIDHGHDQGPTEIRVKNLRPQGVENPAAVPVVRPHNTSAAAGTPLDGFVTLGQGAFRSLVTANRKRKENDSGK